MDTHSPESISTSKSFVHFGCWNKDGCGGSYSESALTQVINNLVQTQEYLEVLQKVAENTGKTTSEIANLTT